MKLWERKSIPLDSICTHHVLRYGVVVCALPRNRWTGNGRHLAAEALCYLYIRTTATLCDALVSNDGEMKQGH